MEVAGILTAACGHVLRTVESPGVHRHQSLEPVAAVDIEHLAYRTEAVRGICVTPMLLVEGQAPAVPVFVPEGVEIVTVCSLGVNHFAEQAFAGHLKGGQLEEIVAAVLEDHTVKAGLLSHIDQCPAVLQRVGRRHFYGCVLSVLHSIKGHRHVMLPVRAYIHQVHVRVLAEFLVGLQVACILSSGWKTTLGKVILGCLDTVRLDIADGSDFHAWDVGITYYSIAAPHSEPHETHADGIHRRDCQAEDIGLPFRPVRHGSDYGPVGIDLVTVVSVAV